MSPVPPRPAEQALTRRGVLGLGLGAGAVLVSGCSLNNPFSAEETPLEEALPDLAPDVALAVRAVVAIRETADLVSSTGRRHPRLVTGLGGLARMHQAHLEALMDAVPERVDLPPSSPPAGVAVRPPIARRRVLAREQRLHDELTVFALEAESGQFARLLGAAAASVSQHLAVLR